MDDIPGILAAILDDLESPAPRLAFADGLEARGEGDRAGWIRASCAFAGVPRRDPRWRDLLERREAARSVGPGRGLPWPVSPEVNRENPYAGATS